MCKQIVRLLHSGLVVVALLPLSPLAPEIPLRFSSWFVAIEADWSSTPVSHAPASQDQPNPSDLSWAEGGPVGSLGLPQTRSGGGTR